MNRYIIRSDQVQVSKWIPDSVGEERKEELSSDAFVEISVDEMCRKAYQEGYAAARCELTQDIQTQVKEAVNAAQDNLQHLHQELTGIKQEIERVTERELIDLCLSVVQHICHKTFSEDSEVIHNMIKHALSLMPTENGRISIYISEKTYQKLTDYINLNEETDSNIHFIVDNKLAIGDFVVDSAVASMDGVLEHRLEKLRNSL